MEKDRGKSPRAWYCQAWGALPGLLVLALWAAGCAHSQKPISPTAQTVSNLAVKPPAANAAWAIGSLSVISAREQPSHKAELGTQVLLGHPVQVLQDDSSYWLYVRTGDGYQAWIERATVTLCSAAQLQTWTNSNLLIVTVLEETLREFPRPNATPVSDLVIGNWIKAVAAEGNWWKVELPDGRSGYVPAASVQPRKQWEASRLPSAENLERTARQFLGRPYLWGGNSPKGLDCSGFTQMVFWLNGIDLPRNASQQAGLGQKIEIDAQLERLRPGDLVYFGRRATGNQPERVTHVGIYLGDKLFVHSSGRVQVSSLDANSSIRDERRISRLLFARRVLPAR